MNRDLSELLGVSTMTLSTTGIDNEPHAAAVYFVASEILYLYFFSDPKSQHSQDVMNNPNAAIAIYPDCRDWRDIHGLQMRGVVRIVKEKEEWSLP